MPTFTRTDVKGKKIRAVEVKREVDDCPDLSYLGEYTSQPGDDDKTIDREERGDRGRHEYRYFVAAMSGEDTGNPESVEQDYRRMEDYNRNEWCMLGITAVAQVSLNGVIQTIHSGGIWGIESDSDKDYLEEMAQEQLNELREQLKAIGFKANQIDNAFSHVEMDD